MRTRSRGGLAPESGKSPSPHRYDWVKPGCSAGCPSSPAGGTILGISAFQPTSPHFAADSLRPPPVCSARAASRSARPYRVPGYLHGGQGAGAVVHAPSLPRGSTDMPGHPGRRWPCTHQVRPPGAAAAACGRTGRGARGRGGRGPRRCARVRISRSHIALPPEPCRHRAIPMLRRIHPMAWELHAVTAGEPPSDWSHTRENPIGPPHLRRSPASRRRNSR